MHINFLLFFQPKESNPEIVQVMPLICDHPSVISECKSQLRESQDEVYQLKNQIIKLKLDLKSKSDDVQRFENKHEAVENHNLELCNCLRSHLSMSSHSVPPNWYLLFRGDFSNMPLD